MASDLLDYARSQFPGHELASWADPRTDLTLQSHTLVVHVVGVEPAMAVLSLAEHEVGDDRVAAVIVKAGQPTVVPSAPEDKNGIIDLPPERVVVSAIIGGLVGVVLGAIAGGSTNVGWVPALIVGGFTGVVGSILGAMAGGGARYAAERATDQPQAPGQDVAIVAAFLDNEHEATQLARSVATNEEQYDIRIVGADGRRHAPGT